MRVEFHKKFKKRYPKLDLKIRKKLNDKLRIFELDPFNFCLNNHRLTGKYRGYRSINITGDWRAFYKQFDNLVVFVLIGTHSELHG